MNRLSRFGAGSLGPRCPGWIYNFRFPEWQSELGQKRGCVDLRLSDMSPDHAGIVPGPFVDPLSIGCNASGRASDPRPGRQQQARLGHRRERPRPRMHVPLELPAGAGCGTLDRDFRVPPGRAIAGTPSPSAGKLSSKIMAEQAGMLESRPTSAITLWRDRR